MGFFKIAKVAMGFVNMLRGFNALWKQFYALIELPRCTCPAETLPNVRIAYAIISSEESHRVASGSITGTSQRCFKIIGYPANFGKKGDGQNFKGKKLSNNNIVGSSSSFGFINEQLSTLISLIKYISLNEKNMQANVIGKEHGKKLYNPFINGPFKYGTLVVPRTPTTPASVRDKTYEDLTEQEKIREACDIRATNIVLQGLPHDIYNMANHHTEAKEIWDRIKLLIKGSKLLLQERESKLYDEFDTFTLEKGEKIRSYYLRFTQLINDMHMIGMSMQPF
nr:retrovirus-related Pol polyprotein from transposon TNT 1-94 [Tanacetum cinerariifolium]